MTRLPRRTSQNDGTAPVALPSTTFDLTAGSFFTRRRNRRLKRLTLLIASALIATPAGMVGANQLAIQDVDHEISQRTDQLDDTYRTLAETAGLEPVTPHQLDTHREQRVALATDALDTQLDYDRILGDLLAAVPSSGALTTVAIDTSEVTPDTLGTLRVTGTADSLAHIQAWEQAAQQLDSLAELETRYDQDAQDAGSALTFTTEAALTLAARSDRLDRIQDRLAPTRDPGSVGERTNEQESSDE